MAEKNEVALTFSEQLTNKLICIQDGLPKDFNRTRFVQNAIAVINEKPELAKVNKGQLMLGLVKGALLNLDYANKEFYLIPYNSNVNFQIDYRGLKKVAKNYSMRKIKDIDAWIVREGDEFEYEKDGDKQYTRFKPVPFSNKDIVGAFCEIQYEDGCTHVEIMSVEDIQSVRNNYSKQKNGTSWTKSFDQMCLKTIIRRAVKSVEIDFASMDARNVWDEDSDMNFIKKQRSDEVVDAFTMEDIEVESTVVEEGESNSDD